MDFYNYVKKDNPVDNIIDVNEVVLNVNNLTKSVKLYNTIFGKKFKGNFKTLGLEEYNRKMGKGKGIRTINQAGEMLRYNWDEKLAKKASYELTSMDYWSSNNVNFQKPTRTIVFGPNTNVIQIIDKVVSELKGKKINESEEIVDEAERTRDEKRAWLKANGIPSAIATADSMIVRSVEELGLVDEYNAFLGGAETNSFEKKLIEVEKKFNSNVYADPDTVFEDVEDLLSVVAAKKWRTFVVCGMGGIGKTWHITSGPRSLAKLLGPEGDKWTYHSGTKAAPFSFYKTLFSERDKIIVFDEADSILKNPDIIMMLKPILDTSGSNYAEYMSGTFNMFGKSADEIEEYCLDVDIRMKENDKYTLPSKFKFTGGMIFISNMRADQIEQAIMSRSIFIDIHLAQQDVLKRINSIMRASVKNSNEYSESDVDEVMESLSGGAAPGAYEEVTYMTPEYARKHKQITVRAAQLALILKKSGLQNWADLAAKYA